MARRALRPCHDCRTALTRDRYCESCAPNHSSHNWNHDKSASDRGYDWQWKKLRDRVMKRDRWYCQPCEQAGRITEATQVDHITPKSEGGTDNPGNLQAICDLCHRDKTRAEAQRAKRRARQC